MQSNALSKATHQEREGKRKQAPGHLHWGPRVLCTGLDSVVWSVPLTSFVAIDPVPGSKGIRAIGVMDIRYHKRNNYYFS